MELWQSGGVGNLDGCFICDFWSSLGWCTVHTVIVFTELSTIEVEGQLRLKDSYY